MATDSEVLAMTQAFALACTPGVPTGPNPRVGAVVLDAGGRVVGEGYHRGVGSPHAEVAALQAAGELAAGGTAVVSLEPCNHTGRTGPCTQALIAAGVRRVVFAQHDLNPIADGGAEVLRHAGIDVEGGVLAAEAEAINEIWSFAVRNQRPFVTWKLAATLDGRSAAADGSARWITSGPARADVHRQRALCDTVLVGTGTVLADDPQLNVRDEHDDPLPVEHQPLRAVMGLRPIADGARVRDATAPTTFLATRDPQVALAKLYADDRQHVFLEGGPTLAAAFVRAGLVDELIAYVSPALLGAGLSAVGDLGVTSIRGIRRFGLLEVVQVGDDVRLTMRSPTRPAEEDR
ncbi:MAG TPA: bifunctional diaminohydroxyphosphoribosylaminopyrimidine deaminase/5-amino-6-(5-phosphoribosylamino)uracil reductase RibD [Nocardioidaceae bacterium]